MTFWNVAGVPTDRLLGRLQTRQVRCCLCASGCYFFYARWWHALAAAASDGVSGVQELSKRMPVLHRRRRELVSTLEIAIIVTRRGCS